MNAQQREKLQKLINTSTILNPQERVEWLALLDVMNDKQLMELERILAPKSSTFAKASADKKFQIPKLSHIINLPKVTPQSQPPQAKQQSDFTKRLESIVREKELPAPAQKPAAPPRVPPVAPLKPSPLSQKEPEMNKEVKDALARALGQKPEDGPESVGGISFTRTSEKDRQETLSSIKEHLREKQSLQQKFSLSPDTAGNADIALEKIEDLEGLSVGSLGAANFDVFLAKVKNLAAKFGYHNTLFSLEKSPLFQSYIITGTELLAKQTDFEQLGGGGYLSKEEFEKLADVLRDIQT